MWQWPQWPHYSLDLAGKVSELVLPPGRVGRGCPESFFLGRCWLWRAGAMQTSWLPLLVILVIAVPRTLR